MIVTLPWPYRGLSPNDRVHWRTEVKARRTYRFDCAIAARASGAKKIEATALKVSLTFHPPRAGRRDTDNMIASAKSGLDGLADVLCVDDSRWELTIARGEPVKGGQIVARIEVA